MSNMKGIVKGKAKFKEVLGKTFHVNSLPFVKEQSSWNDEQRYFQFSYIL